MIKVTDRFYLEPYECGFCLKEKITTKNGRVKYDSNSYYGFNNLHLALNKIAVLEIGNEDMDLDTYIKRWEDKINELSEAIKTIHK